MRPSGSGATNDSVVLAAGDFRHHVVARQRRDHLHQARHQIDALSLEADADRQFQPVDAGRFVQLGGHVAVRLDKLQREVVGDVDLPALGPQLRRGAREEPDPAVATQVLGQHQVVVLRRAIVVIAVGQRAEAELRQSLGNRTLGRHVAHHPIQAAVLRQHRPVLGRRHADRPIIERQPGQRCRLVTRRTAPIRVSLRAGHHGPHQAQIRPWRAIDAFRRGQFLGGWDGDIRQAAGEFQPHPHCLLHRDRRRRQQPARHTRRHVERDGTHHAGCRLHVPGRRQDQRLGAVIQHETGALAAILVHPPDDAARAFRPFRHHGTADAPPARAPGGDDPLQHIDVGVGLQRAPSAAVVQPAHDPVVGGPQELCRLSSLRRVARTIVLDAVLAEPVVLQQGHGQQVDRQPNRCVLFRRGRQHVDQPLADGSRIVFGAAALGNLQVVQPGGDRGRQRHFGRAQRRRGFQPEPLAGGQQYGSDVLAVEPARAGAEADNGERALCVRAQNHVLRVGLSRAALNLALDAVGTLVDQQARDPALLLKAAAGFHGGEAGATLDVCIAQNAVRHDEGGGLHHVHPPRLHRAAEFGKSGLWRPGGGTQDWPRAAFTACSTADSMCPTSASSCASET